MSHALVELTEDTHEQWTIPVLDALNHASTEGTVEEAMHSTTSRTGWVLMAHKFLSGSMWGEDPFGDSIAKIVANRAGHMFLYRQHTTGRWATAWVPFVFQIDNMPYLWGDDASTVNRVNWLAATAVENSVVADDVVGLLDIHESLLSAESDRMHVYDPHFAACAMVLDLDHPDAEAASMLSGLGSWAGHGIRGDSHQPLLGRIRDVQFMSACGARNEHTFNLVAGWRDAHPERLSVQSSTGEWVTRLMRGEISGMPMVLPAVSEANWEALVWQWCEATSRQ